MIKIIEDIWQGESDSLSVRNYAPRQDSKFKQLINKPINTLSLDEIKYIYAIHWAWYMQQAKQYDSIEEILDDIRYNDNDFEICYDFLHSLQFPLKIYRAIWDSQDIKDVYGKEHISWTVDFDIYTNSNSKFKNCNKIISAVIDNPKIISNEFTISNFMYYSVNPKYGYYGEFEITLKSNYKQSDLKDLQMISKVTENTGNGYSQKIKQFTKKEQAEIEDIYYDGYWNIVLKNYDRVLSEESWGEVKWELKQMVKENNFELEW